MRYVICSVRDSKSEAYGRPFFVQATGVALRSFEDEINGKGEQNYMSRHPEDYSLFLLGHFNDHDGTFSPQNPPQLLCVGDQVVQKGIVSAV